MVSEPAPQPIFYYDLGSPWCYLMAEQISSVLPIVPEWEPVHEASLGIAPGELDRAEIARRAAELELQRLRWPPAWPPETRHAMLAASYAKRVGRAVAFSLAAFRQEVAGGRDLGDPDTVLIAAAASEMHPTAVTKGVALRSVSDALARACERARGAGVRSLPAIEVRGVVFDGCEALAGAAAALGGAR